MGTKKRLITTQKSKTNDMVARLLLVIIWPIVFGGIARATTIGLPLFEAFPSAPVLVAIGAAAFVLGRRWYSSAELGLRGGRPMMAGGGFAFLGWVSLLLARFIYAGVGKTGSNLGEIYLYLLLCEALCAQIWVYGVFFRVIADWRGAITATWWSAILYGLVAFQLFAESYDRPKWVLLYFLVWGMLYAIIRLRTGSLWGTVLVQSIQTLTVWQLFPPVEPAFAWIYGMSAILYIVLIWRLIPKYVSDLRV